VAEKPHPGWEFSFLVFFSQPDASGYAARRNVSNTSVFAASGLCQSRAMAVFERRAIR
jgi:hypothetical protein